MRVFLKILIFLLPLHFLTAQHSFIKNYGGKFVDESGQEMFFRGMGLGGWLVPEGYMLHVPGYGSPSDIRNKITDLIGETDTETFYREYEKNYVTRGDIGILARMGFNLIRLPFHYNKLSPQNQPGVYLESGFAQLDSLIEWARDNQMYVVLDMHCAPGGQNSGNISDSDGTARLWTEEANRSHTIAIWKEIASRYANEKVVMGYDLINEPVLPSGHSTTELRALYIAISQAIREADVNHVIIVEGNIYATDFSDLTPPWDSNMAYSFHKYWSTTDQASIQSYLDIRNTWKFPLWMGESGENSNPWFAQTIQLLENNNVSWTWWTHKKIATITSPYSARINAQYQILLDYWNNGGSKPSAMFAKAALFQMAEDLKTSKCTYLPDVVSAMFDPAFQVSPKPFASNQVPGVIPAVHYDNGSESIAYADNDYIKTRWDADQPWNRGYTYRNDGVDIESSADGEGFEYSVGWTNSGEWLNYTMNVQQSGMYTLCLRASAPSAGGRVTVRLDGASVISGADIPGTGGWYNWQDIELGEFEMSSGTHSIRLEIMTAGFNFNALKFTNTSDTGGTEVPLREYRLSQNYPNPFNLATFLKVNVPAGEAFSLEIFDLRGRLIRTLHPLGLTSESEFKWDGRDERGVLLPGGVYFCRLQVGSDTSNGHRDYRKMTLIR